MVIISSELFWQMNKGGAYEWEDFSCLYYNVIQSPIYALYIIGPNPHLIRLDYSFKKIREQ